jgi:hypothetical protein
VSIEFGERAVKRSLKIKRNIQDTSPHKKSILSKDKIQLKLSIHERVLALNPKTFKYSYVLKRIPAILEKTP